MHGYRDKVLAELRSRGERGVLLEELRRQGIVGSFAHVESLRYEGVGTIQQLPDPGLRGQGDARFILTEDAVRPQSSSEEAQAALAEERPVQELLEAPAPTETPHEATR